MVIFNNILTPYTLFFRAEVQKCGRSGKLKYLLFGICLEFRV